VFFVMSTVCAIGLGDLFSAETQSTPIGGPLGTLAGLLIGLAAVMAAFGVWFSLRTRRQYQVLLDTLLYASAYYVPVPALLSLALDPKAFSSLLLDALMSRSLPTLGAVGPVVCALTLMSLGLVVLWISMVARGARAARGHGLGRIHGFMRLGGALALLALAEAVLGAGGSWPAGRQVAYSLAAAQRIRNEAPLARDLPYYGSAETLMRNIAGQSSFPATERYKAQQVASILLVAQCSASAALLGRIGLAPSHGLAPRLKQLWEARDTPSEFESLLESISRGLGKAQGQPRDADTPAAVLHHDVGRLRALRTLNGLAWDRQELTRNPFRPGVEVWTFGLFVCPFPQVRGWPPRHRYAITIESDLPGAEAITWKVFASGNPMERLLGDAAPAKR
jgi:hypothetical protein